MIEAFFLIGAALAALFYPQQETTVVLLDDPDGKVGLVELKTDSGTQVLDKLRQAATAGDTATRTLSADEVKALFGRALSAEPQPPKRFILYFETGGAVLTAASQAALPDVVADVRRRPAPDVAVVGHTDTVGGNDINVRISTQRAFSVRDLLIAAGLRHDVIEVSSHGENNLLVKTPDNTPEPRNRRVEVTIR